MEIGMIKTPGMVHAHREMRAQYPSAANVGSGVGILRLSAKEPDRCATRRVALSKGAYRDDREDWSRPE